MNTPVFSPRSLMPTAGKLPCIVCCTSAQDDWHWLPQELDEKPRQWHFCNDAPQNLWERVIQHPNVAKIRASWQAIQLVKRNQADLLVTNHPTITFWSAVFARLQDVQVAHVASSFYLPRLAGGLQALLMQWAYSSVNRFIVHSRAERQFYSEHFGLPPGRFEMQHWSHETPTTQPSKPLISGEYICAISDQVQDHRSLLAAMATLPDIPLVLVVPGRREIETNITPNVTIRSGLSTTDQMNILKYSRFLVFPFRHAHRPCNPGSLVAAMRLGKAIVSANLPNINDYAFHHSNAVLYESTNVEALASAIRSLWNNLIGCEILGENGQEFAATFCSKASTRRCFSQLLTRRGL